MLRNPAPVNRWANSNITTPQKQTCFLVTSIVTKSYQQPCYQLFLRWFSLGWSFHFYGVITYNWLITGISGRFWHSKVTYNWYFSRRFLAQQSGHLPDLRLRALHLFRHARQRGNGRGAWGILGTWEEWPFSMGKMMRLTHWKLSISD